MQLSLHGKTAFVGGASSGIGRACAVLLAQMGARILAVSRSQDVLEKLITELPPSAGGQPHRALALDLTDRGRLQSALSHELKSGPVEIVVNNSGGPKGGPIVTASDDEFLKAFSGHVLANSLILQSCLPGMKAQGYGRVINIISTSVKVPLPNLGVSNTIRAAVASWAKTASLEVAPFGITVNNVLPGYTETGRLAALVKAAAEKSGKSVNEIEDAWRASVPAARFAKPDEIAAAVGFLASPQAAYINGINLPVDGGRTGSL